MKTFFYFLKTFLDKNKKRFPRISNLLERFGKKVARRFLPSYPKILRNEMDSVRRVLKSPFWNMNYNGNGTHKILEEEFANYIRVKHAISVNTGGMAIQIALRAMGLKPGDEVVHQIDTCSANALSILAANNIPIFSDISADTFMLSEESVLEQISENTKAIMPVHIWGNPENMDMVCSIAQKYSLLVIEDACLALGAKWRGKKVGSIGHTGVFSFGCLKPIQAGEGGMIVTNDEGLARECRIIRNWGDTVAEFGIRDLKTPSWNGRMSEILAAVVLEQLRGYEKHLEQLVERVDYFKNFLTKIDGIELLPSTGLLEAQPSYTQVVVRIAEENVGMKKSSLINELTSRGIQVWHANFEPINSLTFFKNGLWEDWILKGDRDKIRRNYNKSFTTSKLVYDSIGMGFSKSNFLSNGTLKYLINNLDQILSLRTP